MEDLLTRLAPRPSGPPAAPAPELPGGPGKVAASGAAGGLGGRWGALRGRVQAGSASIASWRHFDVALLVFLAALSLGLRWRALWTSYWGDEAIAIGIASHPLGSLPHYLVNDGAPPLYYVMLHYWLQLFGRSGPATHALSMIAALLAIPAAWWSGDKLFGRKAGRGAAALVATSAYLDYYSSETRMYSWLVLASILAVTCFVRAYQGCRASLLGRRHRPHGRRVVLPVLRPVPVRGDRHCWVRCGSWEAVLAAPEGDPLLRFGVRRGLRAVGAAVPLPAAAHWRALGPAPLGARLFW
jgi:hypothetical protein